MPNPTFKLGGTFAQQVSKWVKKGQGRMLVVFRESAQAVANESRVPVSAGGNMPIKTGNLRRSLRGSTSSMPTTSDSKDLDDGSEQITLAIAKAKLGDTIYLGFQANYAVYQEAKRGFVRLTAQRWPEIVKEQSSKLKGRYDSGEVR